MSAFLRLRESLVEGEPLRVLAASGQLGLGIPEPAFRRGVEAMPHVIAADMGSIDPGPSYLGSGRIAAPAALVRRDLEMVLTAARQLGVPLLIGSAGTAGAAPHVDHVRGILKEVARTHALSFRLGVIRSDIPRDVAVRALEAGRLDPIGPMETSREAIGASTHIVGQAGLAPFRAALEMGADVILSGRACDTAPFAVVPILLGFPPGPAMHMAKIIECTSLCCEPGGRDAILATMEGRSFVLESMNPARAATPASVAAHALYEQADPFEFCEPEGAVSLADARYEAVDARRVRVSGADWMPADRMTVKVEAARPVGHRAVLLAGAADPGFIARSDDILAAVEGAVRELLPGAGWSLHFRRYGLDGVLDLPAPATPPGEIFLLGECVAPDTETARTVLAAVRQQLLHFGFEGRLATGGNLAFPVTPAELDAGPAYEFSLYHIMTLESREAYEALFPVELEDIGDPT